MKKLTSLPLLTLMVAFLGTSAASAATKTWVPTTGGAWTSAANWSPSGAPAVGDGVTINSDQSANITAVPTITLSNLTVSGNCTLAAATSGNTITVTNSFSVSASKTLTIGPSGSRMNFTLSSTATGTVNGTVTQSAGTTVRTFTCNGTLIMAPPGVINGAGAFTLAPGATLQIGSTNGITSGTTASGNIQVTGTRSFNTGANYIYNGTAPQVTSNGLPTTVNSLTDNNTSGTVTLSRVTTNTTSVTLASGAQLRLPSGTSKAATLVIGGISQAAGTWGATASGATHIDNTHFAGTGVLNVTTGGTSTATTVTSSANPSTYGQLVSFTATVTGSGATGTVQFQTNAVNFGSPVTLSSSSATSAASIFAAGNIAVTANYSGDSTFLASTGTLIQTNNKATVTPTVTLNNKVYDGTTAATTIATRSLGGVVDGDDVSLGTSGTVAAFSTKNVGTYTVSVTGLSLSGTTAGNYQLSTTSVSPSASITARPITVTAATNTKTYDGTTSAAATGSITSGSIASGDTAPTWTETYDTKDQGTGKTLTASGTVSDGNSGNNYSVTFVSNTTGIINRKALTYSGPSVPSSKVYDGTTTATVSGTAALQAAEAAGTGSTSDGKPYSVDSVGLSGTATGTYNSKNVASATTVTFGGLSLTGTGGGNYSLTPLTQPATITPKGLTVSGITAANKVYDGTTTATLNTGSAALVGVVSGDTVNLNTGSAAGAFADANAGTGKTVGVSGLTISGTDSGNYSLTQPTTTADITKASTTSVVASSGNPSLPGANVTFTNTLRVVAPGGGTPTGTIQFRTNGVAFGSPVPLSGGIAASPTTAWLPHGSNTVTAEYAGDGNFIGSTNSVSQVVNTPPAAGTHFLGATVNTPLNVSASTLAGLDYDADGDALTIAAVSNPSTNGASVTLNSGTITYTPVNNYVGADQFSYAIADGFGGTNLCTAKVTVRLGKTTSVFNYISPPVNGSVDLRGYGIPGHQYDVQASSDMSNWTTLATVTAAANAIILYTDNSATNSPRYYRFAVH
jgi:hypothetical protein